MTEASIGRGWAFPPSFSRTAASVRMAEGGEKIRQSLVVLLGTTPGERSMRPTYGCDLQRFVFRTATQSVLAEIREAVDAAVRLWEPRIELTGVQASAADEPDGPVLIEISFTLKTTRTRGNLVYPFYLGGPEAGPPP